MTAGEREAPAGPYVVYCDTKSTPECHLDIGLIVRNVSEVADLLSSRGWVGPRGNRTCPGCLCAPTEGPVWAYYGQRAITRKSTKGEPRHAVAAWSRLGGAMDAECGVIGAIELGPWDPADPINCAKCAKFIAGAMPMPPDPIPVEQPAEPMTAAAAQLALFDAA